jgi:hypothetical protein
MDPESAYLITSTGLLRDEMNLYLDHMMIFSETFEEYILRLE